MKLGEGNVLVFCTLLKTFVNLKLFQNEKFLKSFKHSEVYISYSHFRIRKQEVQMLGSLPEIIQMLVIGEGRRKNFNLVLAIPKPMHDFICLIP